MTVPRVLLVTDPARSRHPPLHLIAEAAEGGIDAIYLRHLTPEQDWVAELSEVRAHIPAGVPLFVPGSPPRGLHNTGQHLRERDPLPDQPPDDRPDLISRSVHSPLAAAGSSGVTFVIAGHVFATASHPGEEPLGVAGLADIVAAAPCPVVAIGGITPERVPDVIGAGAYGVAVISAISEAPDPRAAARELRAAVDAARDCYRKGREMQAPSSRETLIEIMVNGKPREIPADSTVHDLLASRKLAASMAIVERNGIILPRDSYATTVLSEGDHLEVVHAVGGG